MQRVVEDAVGTLFRELHHARPPAPLGPHSRLDADLGFDSLVRAELLARLERRLSVELRTDTLASLDTIADLVRAVSSAPKAHGSAGRTASSAAAAVSRLVDPGTDGRPESAATLLDVLDWRAARDPHATHAIVLGEDSPQVLSYAHLRERAQAVASVLQGLGLARGSSVALMLPTSADYLHALFGVLLAGAVPVPLYPPVHRTQLEQHVRRHAEILANADSQVLITIREIRPVARLLKSRTTALRHILSMADLAPGAQGPPPEPDRSGANSVSGTSTALLQYTSGSTGSPKGVVLTHAQLLANIRAMGASIGATDRDVFVSWLPLYHDMGLIGAWLASLYFGCLLVLLPPTAFLARPARWLRTLADYRATLTAAPNFAYELAARRPAEQELQGLDLASVRVSFNGAEPVQPGTLERFRARFAPYGFRAQVMTPVYGLAEAGVGLTFPPPGRGPIIDRIDREQLARRGLARPVPAGAPDPALFVSCGAPLPGYRLRVVDERGIEVGERIEGDLQFAGPSATNGYFRNVEATERLLCGMWRNTGDRAYLAAGELYVTGRAKDIVIRRGRHIYPQEIESAVGELAGARRGCVVAFGTQDEVTGTERLIVVAETRLTDPLRRLELKARIIERVTAAAGEPADEIVLAAPHAVLKTSSGKLRRAATRDAYLDGTLGRAVGTPTLQMARLLTESVQLTVRRRVDAALRLAFGIYAWSLLLPTGAVAAGVTLLLRNPTRIWRLNHQAARLLWRLLRMPAAVTDTERAGLSTPQPHIVAVNHASYADSLLIAALLAQPHRFVAKAELARVPVLGRYLRKLRTLFVDRFEPGQGVADIGLIREALRRGDCAVVFPEGTFTSQTGLREFHLGAFQAAAAEQVPIIPLALKGTRSVLRDGRWLPRRAPIEAVFGAPLLPRADEDRFTAAVRLREETRAFILQHCGEPSSTA
jgi:1-acyl-sn-glycerol-3-phosphate acyltransferase